MNSELKQIRSAALEEAKRVQDERCENCRPMVEALLDKAVVFFKNNPNKDIFSATFPVKNKDFKRAMEKVAKEEKYQFDVRFGILRFWKVFIHVDKDGFEYRSPGIDPM